MQTGLQSNGDLYLDGQPYTGPYYRIYTGEAFTGDNPYVGSNNPLTNPPPLDERRPQASPMVRAYNQAATNNTPTIERPLQRVGSGKLVVVFL